MKIKSVLLILSIQLGCLAGCDLATPVITGQPKGQVALQGDLITFHVTASGTPDLAYQWQINGTPIGGATLAAFTTRATLEQNGASFSVVVSNHASSVTSEAASLQVLGGSADTLTYHSDAARTGANLNEIMLAQSNVNVKTFGKLGFYPADGKVDGQPLYVANLSTPNQGVHNVLYVVTEHDTVYAFDADSGSILWQISTLELDETPSDFRNCFNLFPEKGITATPVIDRDRGPHGVIYLVAMAKDSTGRFTQRLHALDLATGSELFGGPVEIQATFPGSGENSENGLLRFDPSQYIERAALLLSNSVVYTTWSSHCDTAPYNGWMMGYDADTLAQVNVLNLTPNGTGGAIWMSGGGPASDANGNIYVLGANGTFDKTLDAAGRPILGDYGNSFLKVAATTGLSVADYFTVLDVDAANANDTDLGSGGALILPDLTDAGGNLRHLEVGAGKDRQIYLIDRDNMGKFNPAANAIYQQVAGLSGGNFSSPAYFNQALYFGAVHDSIKRFPLNSARLADVPASQTPGTYGYPGATPTISANGEQDAILWALENGATAVLHAYDANDLSHELYNSDQPAGGRDQFGNGNKFITPTVAHGKVFVATPNGIAVFGLFPQ